MTTIHSGDLERLERLGGSRAVVHRAVVRTTGRVVVVKHAPWDRPDAIAGLGREAAVLQRVRHASLVRLLDTIDDANGRALVLAHAPGGSLAERLERDGPLPAAAAADLGARVAEALMALHRAGVVHRDVQPGNVLVDAELLPVLADLDHALDRAGEQVPADDEVVGHPAHVDHRLFAGEPAGPAADLHGLATTLWTITTGGPPPRPGPDAPVTLPPHALVPPPLHRVLAACLDRSIDDASAAANALRVAALELSTGPTPPPAGHAAPTLPPRPAPMAPAPAPRAGSLTGAGGGDATTRRWGTPPPSADSAGVVAAAAAAAQRRGWVVAAIAVAVLGIAAVAWRVTAERDPGPGAAVAVTAPPICDGAPLPPGAVAADLHGGGCSQVLRLVDAVLSTPTGDYELGEPGDVLVAGDWDGDGRWSPGLYRPATGEVFLFDDPPGDEPATSRPAEQLAPAGRPLVIERDGVHVVVVEASAT